MLKKAARALLTIIFSVFMLTFCLLFAQIIVILALVDQYTLERRLKNEDRTIFRTF